MYTWSVKISGGRVTATQGWAARQSFRRAGFSIREWHTDHSTVLPAGRFFVDSHSQGAITLWLMQGLSTLENDVLDPGHRVVVQEVDLG